MVCDDARTKCTIEWSLNPDAYPKIFWVFFTFFFIMLCKLGLKSTQVTFSQIGIVIVDDYNKGAKANESKQMLRRTESSVVLAESADGAELESASN